MQHQAGTDQVRPGSRERAWPKQEVKALKQALKDVPSALDKNERFRRVSALVGGGHSKKDCYDKYRELKAEAKLKQTTLRTASGMSVGSTSCRDHYPLAKKHMAAGYDDATNAPSSVGSGRLSRRGSAFSSWSSNSADVYGQQQQQQQHSSRRSTASSTLSSVPSEPPEDIIGCGSTDRGTRGSSLSRGVCEHDSLEDMGAGEQPSRVYDSKRAPQGSSSGTRSAGGLAITRRGGGTQDTAREAVYNEEELMEVEEVDVEDFCLDDELLVAEQHVAAGTTQTKARGQGGWQPPRGSSSSTGGYSRGRNSQTSATPAHGGDSGGDGGAERLVGRAMVTEAEANGVRELVFGGPSKSFNDAWREQGFYFCGVDGLRYGLVQAEGGPCGVLAAVQAFLLEDMIFGDSAGCDWRNPKRSQRERSLASALTSIIWRAGDGKTAVLAVLEGGATVQRSSRYRPDGFTERLNFHRVGSRSALLGLLRDNLPQYKERKGQGVILLVYSCIFSRGIETVRGDMDNSFGEPSTLMARHGYASQELVNLLLLGRAHSNVFDGRRVMGDGSGDATTGGRRGEGEEGGDSDRVVLTGVPQRGRVGFLTLFEAYKHVEVGDRLKTPETPVWVVCSESHYSILFCVDRSIVSSASSLTAAANATTSALEAARDQSKQGKTRDHTPNPNNSARPTASIETNATFSRTDGTKNACTVGRGRGEDVSGMASGGGRWGGYDGALDGEPRQEEGDDLEAFDLQYYDGLGRQDEVIRLTVDQRHDGGDRAPPPTTDDEANGALVPPLDLVIRTRWPGAAVDWNGSDPIL